MQEKLDFVDWFIIIYSVIAVLLPFFKMIGVISISWSESFALILAPVVGLFTIICILFMSILWSIIKDLWLGFKISRKD